MKKLLKLFLSLFTLICSYSVQVAYGQYVLDSSHTPPAGTVFESYDGFLPLESGKLVNNVTMQGWYLNDASLYRGGDKGTNANGGFYAFNDNKTETALGFLTTPSVPLLRAGLRIKNNAHKPFFGFLMAYRGEQWRMGENGNHENRIVVEYMVKNGGLPADNVNDPGIWYPVRTRRYESLDFIAPTNSKNCNSGGVNINGNTFPNVLPVPTMLTNGFSDELVINHGEEIMIRFSVYNQTCANHGMAIDDLVIIPVFEEAKGPLFESTPNSAANVGKTMITLYGDSFEQGTGVKLIKDGITIQAERVISINPNTIKAIIDVDGKPIGKYHVIASFKDGKSDTLFGAFSLEEKRVSNICAQITGRRSTRGRTLNDYQITLTQDGNVDAYNVPLWISVDDLNAPLEAQFSFASQTLLNGYWQNVNWQNVSSSFIHNGKKYFALMLPTVPRNQETVLHFRLTTPGVVGKRITLQAHTSLPLYGNQFEKEGKNCIYVGLASIITEAVPEALPKVDNVNLFHACLKAQQDTFASKLKRLGESLLGSEPVVMPLQAVWYASALEVLRCMNVIYPMPNKKNSPLRSIVIWLAD